MYPTLFVTPGLAVFAMDVDTERQRQIVKFGKQQHPDGTGPGITSWAPLMNSDQAATSARTRCQNAAARGDLTWRHILAEEVAEAFAESDPDELRTELVQVAAVCAAWIADLDSRPPTCTCDSEDHTHDGGCPLAAPGVEDPHFPAAQNQDGALLRALHVAMVTEPGLTTTAHEEQHAQRPLGCSLVTLHQPHEPHTWEPQPGMSLRCSGTAESRSTR